MKSLNLLSIVIILSVSAQALAQVPPPLKPVEYLEPDDLKTTPSQPAKPTAPPVVAPQPVKPPVVVTQPTTPPVVQPTKPTMPPVVQPTKPTNPPVVTQPAKPTVPPTKPPVLLPPTQPVKPPVVVTQPPKPVAQPPKPVVTQPVKPNKVGAFKIGDEVATDRHEIGYIVDFPSSQSALVRFPRGTYEWPVNRLSFLLNTSRGFRVGQVVINDRHERGVIELIFADETAIVRFASGAYNWPLGRLNQEITKIDGFAVGQSVVTDRHERGVIVEVYSDHSASVRFASGTYNWPTSRLAHVIASIDGFSVGMSVVTDRHDSGVIVEVFNDRTATVRFRGGETYNWPLSRLGREVTTLDGFQIGQSVATDRRDTGVIEQIFADHTANVRFRGGEVFNWPLNRLGPAFYSPRTGR